MRPQSIQLFKYSAGILLLVLASSLFLINWTIPAESVSPMDPILNLSLRTVFWLAGSIALASALICLFVTQPKIPLCLIAWLATNFIVYQIGLFWGGSHELAGFLAGFSYTFGVHPKIFDLFVRAASAYLFLGSYTSLWCLRKYPTSVPDPPTVALQPVKIQRDTKALVRTLKIACTACGGHIEFPTNSFGEKVPCPHCHTTITLQKSRSLRMACPACAGRIEFPEYAIGQTIPCPHCKTGITLKEPA